jgi:hypothetical protein
MPRALFLKRGRVGHRSERSEARTIAQVSSHLQQASVTARAVCLSQFVNSDVL